MGAAKAAKSLPGPNTRGLLEGLAKDNLGAARLAAREVLAELAKPDHEDDVLDGHILDLRWALGERRGVLNALHDLDEAGLLSPRGR